MGKSAYEALGVSATKAEVHEAVEQTDPGLFPGAFCRIGPDILGGDPDWCCAIHSDDAGTKVLVAYLLFKETGDPRHFRGIAEDALVMNLDDLACVGAVDRFLLSNTINRNSFHVPGSVIKEVIAGYGDVIRRLGSAGVNILATGGETADMVDVVRTILVGATVATRLRRDQVVDNDRISAGDLIVGLSSTGKATYEDNPNSGIGDNGLTLARHALLKKDYAHKYPEALAKEVDLAIAYRGPFALADEPAGLGMSVGAALHSPTRSYVPVVREALAALGRDLHGMVHNTGGGQAKCLRFGKGIAYVKDDLFPVPPLFSLIAEHGGVEWKEMYQTFNMGHRFELMVPPERAATVMEIAGQFGIEAKVVGRCHAAAKNSVTLETPKGTFEFS
ncbi:MAG: AIR synthase-related protein [Planctomycetota bacterium]